MPPSPGTASPPDGAGNGETIGGRTKKEEPKEDEEKEERTSSSLWRCLLPALAGVLTFSAGVLRWDGWLVRLKLGDRRPGTNTLLTWGRGNDGGLVHLHDLKPKRSAGTVLTRVTPV